MADKKIDVPQEVIVALAKIRNESKYNMMDAQSVVYEMNEQKMYGSVVWLTEIRGDKVKVNKERYLAALHEMGEIRGLAYELGNN